jgi:hypothetical protein
MTLISHSHAQSRENSALEVQGLRHQATVELEEEVANQLWYDEWQS